VNQRLGAFAVLGIGCAVVAFFLSPLAGVLLALLAVVLGAVGFLRSASPRVRGGMMSLAAIALGAVGVVVKILHGALSVVF
jgi:hypothetical protein